MDNQSFNVTDYETKFYGLLQFQTKSPLDVLLRKPESVASFPPAYPVTPYITPENLTYKFEEWGDFLRKELNDNRYNFQTLQKLQTLANNLFKRMKIAEDATESYKNERLNRAISLLNEQIKEILATTPIRLANTSHQQGDPNIAVMTERVKQLSELELKSRLQRLDRLVPKRDEEWKARLKSLYLSLPPEQMPDFGQSLNPTQIQELFNRALEDQEMARNFSHFLTSLPFEQFEQLLVKQPAAKIKILKKLLSPSKYLFSAIFLKFEQKLESQKTAVKQFTDRLKVDQAWKNYAQELLQAIKDLELKVEQSRRVVESLETIFEDQRCSALIEAYEGLIANLRDSSQEELNDENKENVYQVMAKEACNGSLELTDDLFKTLAAWGIVKLEHYKEMGLFNAVSQETYQDWTKVPPKHGDDNLCRTHEAFKYAIQNLEDLGFSCTHDLFKAKIYNPKQLKSYLDGR
jgi:hypothetical protein